MKLLLVEDSQRLRDTLARGLRADGFAVDAAQDETEAIGLLAASDYDLVLFDIGSWRVSDVEALHAVLAGGSRPRPHVMVLSERDQLADRVDALNSGADDYLVKPFAFEEVMARLHALARRAERAL